MARFWKKSWDWCHICGVRQGNCVEIAYPSNAEHQLSGDGGTEGDEGKFVRICADCGETIVRIGSDEMTSAVRNNPAVVTAHIKGISPSVVPDLN